MVWFSEKFFSENTLEFGLVFLWLYFSLFQYDCISVLSVYSYFLGNEENKSF